MWLGIWSHLWIPTTKTHVVYSIQGARVAVAFITLCISATGPRMVTHPFCWLHATYQAHVGDCTSLFQGLSRSLFCNVSGPFQWSSLTSINGMMLCSLGCSCARSDERLLFSAWLGLFSFHIQTPHLSFLLVAMCGRQECSQHWKSQQLRNAVVIVQGVPEKIQLKDLLFYIYTIKFDIFTYEFSMTRKRIIIHICYMLWVEAWVVVIIKDERVTESCRSQAAWWMMQCHEEWYNQHLRNGIRQLGDVGAGPSILFQYKQSHRIKSNNRVANTFASGRYKISQPQNIHQLRTLRDSSGSDKEGEEAGQKANI